LDKNLDKEIEKSIWQAMSLLFYFEKYLNFEGLGKPASMNLNLMLLIRVSGVRIPDGSPNISRLPMIGSLLFLAKIQQ
jgi:hypothetical protein